MDTTPLDHAGLEVIPYDECLRLLARSPVGRFAFAAYGEVVVLPVNHALDGDDVVFRTSYGLKLDAAEDGSHVAFEVDHFDADFRRGWSVLVSGVAERVYDDAEIDRLERLGVRPWVDAPRDAWVRIRPLSITGRRTPSRDAAH